MGSVELGNNGLAVAGLITEVTPWEELEPMLRQITLLDQPDTRPYKDARMSIERFKLSELLPTTRYVEAALLATQAILRNALLPQGYDQLDLQQGRLTLTSPGGLTARLAPPIVERYEGDGDHLYILDGSHRAELARQIGKAMGVDPELTVIFVRDGISVPPYAYPNDWKDVRVVANRPDDKSLWKYYRDFFNRYHLYKDYGRVFDSAPRGLDV